ncbi:cytochrome P450 [Pilatotrama ljubarskyi]|nr:cytochrome P450 [Pilatotrama ljubarskyi]
MEEPTTALSVCAGVATILVLYFIKWRLDPLHAIPTVGGSSLPILSYIAARDFMHNGRKYLEEGYRKYHGSAFKVPLLDRWMVVVSGPEMVHELRSRPDDELSFQEEINDAMQMRHIASRSAVENPFHIDIVKDKLTRGLPVILPDVLDELHLAIPQYIPAADEDSWLEVDTITAMQHIIARASARAFIGLPGCRNEEYLECAISYTIKLVNDTDFYTMFPKLLKPFVSAMHSTARRTLVKAATIMEPLIHERRALGEALGDDGSHKPNDMLQWLVDSPEGKNDTLKEVSDRVMMLNFAAIHTSSNVSHRYTSRSELYIC